MLNICLRRFVADLLARRTGFIPQAVHMRSVVVKVTLSQVLRFFAVSIIPSVFLAHSFTSSATGNVANTQQTPVIH
jgi:hypothetical protein